MSQHYDAVVVGAGITGLSCAYQLHKAGLSVLVLERSPQVGGAIRSAPLNGGDIIIDHGPQTVRSGDPDLLREFDELGIAGDRVVAGSAGKNRYILWGGELVPIPMSPPAFATSKLLPLAGKLRLFGEPFVKARPDGDESIEAFFGRRLGRDALDRMVDPFVSGVYAGDPAQLSMKAVFPSLKEGVDTHGSLLKWGLSKVGEARAARKSGTPRPKRARPELFSFKGGLGQWTQALARALGPDRVQTEAEITGLQRRDGGWRITVKGGALRRTRIDADQVVLAMPAPAAADLLAADFPGEVRGLRDIPYAPVATVHLSYARVDVSHPMDGFGYLCPSSQERPVLGILWISSLFPERVAADRTLTTTFVGGARQPENALLPDEEIIRIADAEHRRFLGTKAAPRMAKVVRHRQAIPQYEFGHLERVAAAERIEDMAEGLHLAGAYRGGVSVSDCWKNGREVARRIVAERPAGRSASAPAPESREAETTGV